MRGYPAVVTCDDKIVMLMDYGEGIWGILDVKYQWASAYAMAVTKGR